MARINNPNRIVLTCSSLEADTVSLIRDGRYIAVKVETQMMNSFDAAIYLDDESAREMFNWLGVWLHDVHR